MKRKPVVLMRALLLLFVLCSPALAESPWKWSPKSVTKEGPDYHFEWGVPRMVSAPGDVANWQKLLDRRIADRANEFQNAFEEDRKENPGTRDYQPLPWESTGNYQVVWADDTHLVLLWQGYDFRGGAHGLPIEEVTVLDSEQSDLLLPPTSLFTDETSVLQALSAASRAALPEQLGETPVLDDWALRGTEPRWENFRVVYPTEVRGPRRFEVIFPAYQVAPYAAGTPTVSIPWSVLSPWTPALEKDLVQP